MLMVDRRKGTQTVKSNPEASVKLKEKFTLHKETISIDKPVCFSSL